MTGQFPDNRRIFKVFTRYSLIVAIAMAYWTLDSQPVQAAGRAESAALTVQLDVATAGDWPQRVQAAGSIRPWQEALVSAETGGLQVVSVEADIGDVVRKGQLLARLASESVNAELQEYRARVAEAEAQLEEARADAERSRTVKGSGALSAQQSEQYRLREAAAQARRDAAQAKLEGLQVRFAQTRVTAPDDGVITDRKAVLGQVVQTGTELFRLMRQQKLEWYTEVTLEQFPKVKTGQPAWMLLPDGAPVEGRVRVVYPQLTVGALVGNVLVSLPVDSRLQSGYLAYGFIDVGTRKVVSVRQTAVSWRDGKSYVFVCGDDNRVRMTRVELGQVLGDRVEVRYGVKEAEPVVAEGSAYLSDGDLVRRVDATP